MKGIASALHVAPESLFDVPAATARKALELIFRIDEEFGLKPKEIGGELDGRIDRLFEIDAFRIGRCRDVRGPDAPHHIGSSDLAEHGHGVARLAE